ncbi:hypothetical protein, partial [Colwellia psychrerythraea]|uniref:Aspartate/glutamate/uridylate kinase n=1 Tax=Colwellia psychrerythraea TaxID=28229 RepID=A0A099L604_COLPS
MNRSVHKFGGSSLSTATHYQAVANIITSYCQFGDIIVVSAAGKTTNMLVKLWQYYKDADNQGVISTITQLKDFQTKLIEELLEGKVEKPEIHTINEDFSVILKLIAEKNLKEKCLLAYGEVWSARLLSQYLNHLSYHAIAFDARDLLLVNDGKLAHPENKINLKKLNDSQLNVVTGFIAQDTEGYTTTLGRNGSDYSATLIARYCDASSVTIWKDTKGIYSADPHDVEHALQYLSVCREQISLLTKLGSPILHTKTLEALEGTDIKIIMRSSFENDACFTKIESPTTINQKCFITSLHKQSLIEINHLSDTDVLKLKQLTQCDFHTFKIKYPNGLAYQFYLIVPVNLTHSVLHYFSGRANLLASSLFGLGIIGPRGRVSSLTKQAVVLLKKININIRFSNFQYQGIYGGYGMILSNEVMAAETLSRLHDALFLEHKAVITS